MFNWPTYRITRSAHPVKCPPQCPSPIRPIPHPPPLPAPLVLFPELGVFMISLPSWYFPNVSSPFPYIPFHYYLYSPKEWEHTLSFSDWLTSLSIKASSSIHVETNVGYLSFLMVEYYSIVYINHIFFIHSSFDGHQGSWHCFAIVDIVL